MRRVYLEVYRLPIYSLVIPCYPECFIFDLPLDFCEIKKSLPRKMVELCPFWLASDTFRCVWDMDFVVVRPVVALTGDVDELKDERTSGNDAASSGKEVPPDDVL